MIVKKIYENSGDDSIVPVVKRGKIVDLVISNSNRSVCPPLYKVFKIFEYTASNGKKSYFAAFVPKNDEYNNDKSICMLFLGGNAFSSHVIYDVHNVYFNKDNDRLFVTRWAANDKLSMFMYNLCDLVLEEDYIVDTIDASNGIAICQNSYADDVPIRFPYHTITDFKECVLLNGNTFKNKKVERIFVMNKMNMNIAKCPFIVQYKNDLLGIWYDGKWVCNSIKNIYYDNDLYLTDKNGKINVFACLTTECHMVLPIWCDGALMRFSRNGCEFVFKSDGGVAVYPNNNSNFFTVDKFRDEIKNKYKNILDSIDNTPNGEDKFAIIFNNDKIVIYYCKYYNKWIKKGEYDDIGVIHHVYNGYSSGYDVFVCKHDNKIDAFDSYLNVSENIFKNFEGDIYSIVDELGDRYLVTKENNNDTYTVHFENPIKNVVNVKNIYDTLFVLKNGDGEFTLSSYKNHTFNIWARKLKYVYDRYPVFVVNDNGKDKFLVGVVYSLGRYKDVCFPYIKKKWLDEIIKIDTHDKFVEGKIGDEVVRYSLDID